MDTDNEFQQLYDTGRSAFERGAYRLSIEQLEQARQKVPSSSPQAGEAGIWLVSAYQGMGDIQAAQFLCQQLTQHPKSDIRKQAQQMLYILEAPQLKRPEAWMSKIPDLEKLPESEPKYQKGSYPKRSVPEQVGASGEVNSQDNQFIWVALLAIALSLGIWLGLTQL